MTLFPISIPTFALSISEDTLCLVEITKQWRKVLLRQVTRVPLPHGVVKLSSAKPNIEDTDEFLNQLNTLVQPYKRPFPIVLSLPDLCARTSVFDFFTFPHKKLEQTALVNWRFQQDLKLDISHSRLAFGVYVPESATKSTSPDTSGQIRVLGTAIRNEIVEQYEKMCLEAQLIPTAVGMSGLDIFDLYRSNIRDLLESVHRPHSIFSAEVMFLFISHWGFTFLAFQDGSPRFIRTKAITVKAEPGDESPETVSPEFDRTEDNLLPQESASNPYPSYTTMKIGKEILATLQYYLETFPAQTTSPRINLFVATDLSHGHHLMPSTEHIQHTLRASGGQEPEIFVTPLSHTSHFHLPDSRLMLPNQEEAALPGYASLMVA